MLLDFFTTGESHGPELTSVITGIPAGIYLDNEYIDNELSKRQQGYGRGDRMKIEKDKVQVVSGISKKNITTGAPITFKIKNKDYENWKNKDEKTLSTPRPAHADLFGVMKYDLENIRDVIERSSARETAARVSCGAFFKYILEKHFNVKIISFLSGINGIGRFDNSFDVDENDILQINRSEFSVRDKNIEPKLKKIVDNIKEKNDSIGGILNIVVKGIVPGLGSFVDFHEKLDSDIAQAIMSIQSIKGVIFGNSEYSLGKGSEFHDELFLENEKITFKTNNCGGIIGGMSTGQDINIQVNVKPIPTLMQPLNTFDIKTGKSKKALKERSDVWAVPAAGIVCESMCAFIVLKYYLKKFSGDNINDTLNSFEHYRSRLKYV